MGQSNKKIRTALYIGIGVSILSVIAIAVVLYPYFLAKSLKMQDLDGLFGKKYVSEYDLKLGRNRDLKDNWNVAKLKKDDGTEYLRIVKIIDPDEPMDYLHFEVYENSSDAEKAYRKLYNDYKAYDYDFKKGDGYFKSYDPFVDDVKIYEMVYLKDNVIIFAELSIVGCYWDIEETVPVVDSSDEPTSNVFDRARLEKYIVNNSDYIKKFVLKTLLKY
ncbi:MAG: hypothetical protein IKT10_02275 [Clostridiales bacterium]|nr:hypothetical protein [Clostridiales bacterium]